MSKMVIGQPTKDGADFQIVDAPEGTPEWFLIDEEEKGGAGSGHFEHAGRPGEVGGSAPRDWARYHGTYIKAADDILENGFQVDKTETGRIFVATDPDRAWYYGREGSRSIQGAQGLDTPPPFAVIVIDTRKIQQQELPGHMMTADFTYSANISPEAIYEINIWDGEGYEIIETILGPASEQKALPQKGYVTLIWDEKKLEFVPTSPVKGGEGSGHHGHSGRPGEVGGSLPEGEARRPLEEGEVPVHERGSCFECAGKFLLDNPNIHDDAYLVHGTVAGQGRLEGIRFSHAWIEMSDGEVVVDPTNSLQRLTDEYYELGKVKDVIRYTFKEMLDLILETEHWGPWDEYLNAGPWEEKSSPVREIDLVKALIALKGGPGSGHEGHVGRPGEVGGSLPAGAPPNLTPEVREMYAAALKRQRGLRAVHILDEMDPEEREAHQKKLDELVGDADIWIAVKPHSMKKIIEQGAVKTVFETGRTGAAAGASDYYKEKRTEFENIIFEQRPIYGYLSSSGRSSQWTVSYPDRGDPLLDDGAWQYGTVRLRLKDSVKDRSTFIDGDSLDSLDWSADEGHLPFIPTAVNDPGLESLMSGRFNYTASWQDEHYEQFGGTEFLGTERIQDIPVLGYFEVQIAGGSVDVSEIAEVVSMGKPLSKATQNKLDKLGIPWREVEVPIYDPDLDYKKYDADKYRFFGDV